MEIKERQTVWVVPWAICRDNKGRIWLDADQIYPSDGPHGTSTANVTRQNGELIADVRNCSKRSAIEFGLVNPNRVYLRIALVIY